MTLGRAAPRFLLRIGSGRSTDQAGDQTQQEQNDEDEEQDLGNSSGRAGDAAEAENGRDDRDYQECQCPAKHESTPF